MDLIQVRQDEEGSYVVQTAFTAFTLNTAIISCMTSVVLLTTQPNLSLKGLASWLLGVSLLNPCGSLIGE